MSRLRAYKDSEGHPERGIYEDPESGSKYIRIRENGRDTFKSVGSSKITQAIKMRNTREAAKAAARLGIAMEPTEAEKQAKAKAMSPSVSQAIKRYQDDGYPDKRGEPKALDAIHRIAEAKYCETLLEYFKGNTLAESLDQDALDGYRNWRRQHVRTCNGKQDGARTTDLELNTLSNALNWAVRKKLIKVNPILNRVRYHSRADARQIGRAHV